MLMTEATEDMVIAWKKTYEQYKNQIHANKKEGTDLINYIESKYDIIQLYDKEWEDMVAFQVHQSTGHEASGEEEEQSICIYQILDTNQGSALYRQQDEVFKGMPIIVGIELCSASVIVEGSSYLYDELIAYRGLDEEEIKNYFLVAQYINCKEKMKN